MLRCNFSFNNTAMLLGNGSEFSSIIHSNTSLQQLNNIMLIIMIIVNEGQWV